MLGEMSLVRHDRFVLLNQTAAATLKVTTSIIGDAINAAGMNGGILDFRVISVTTGAVSAYLQGRVDTTNWFALKTISADLTTTANSTRVIITTITRELRMFLKPATTSSKVRTTLKAELWS